MLEMLIGVAVGYMAFTENGRDIGNKTASFLTEQAKKVIDNVKSSEDTAHATESDGARDTFDTD